MAHLLVFMVSLLLHVLVMLLLLVVLLRLHQTQSVRISRDEQRVRIGEIVPHGRSRSSSRRSCSGDRRRGGALLHVSWNCTAQTHNNIHWCY
jgi:hypothetical protein